MLDYENKYRGMVIAGIDEAGRGPLAGPVVCACAVMPLGEGDIIEGINDSKKLTEKKREALFEQIISKAISYCIVEVSESRIDEINILNATKEGMIKALNGLNIIPDVVLVDAVKLDIPYKQDNIIKGDALSYNIASASILAKVYRDRLMKSLDLKYPEYNFAKHKGYGTQAHIDAIKEHGPCPLHRRTFIKNFID